MKEDLTEIVLIVDRSGSMASIKEDAQGGFNEFIEEQKKLEGEARVTLIQFDTEIDTVYDNVNINEVKEYTLIPRSMTALLDAVGYTISKVGERLSNTPEEEKPSKVMVCIITDGQENSSKEYDRTKIKEMIEHQRTKYSWEFVFIGANVDAFSEAGSLGVLYSATYDATGKGIKSAFSYSSDMTKTLRSGVTLDTYSNHIKLDS